MKTEVEAKFLDVSIEVIRAKLKELGAVCEQPMRLMRRVTIDNPEMTAKSGFLRVRDEGNRVTATYKQFDASSVDGAKEIEIVVDDFDQTVALLGAVGLPHSSFQESKRETWRFGEVEIVIDEWPWLNPYIEIEGDSEVKLKDVATKLGFEWSRAVFGDVTAAYRVQYPHLNEKVALARIAEVKFGDPLPDLLKA